MEFEKTLRINAPAEKIFGEASDINKLPKWMPAKLHEQLIAHNPAGRFDIAGYVQLDQAKKRLTWDDGQGYKGFLQIKNAGQAADVTIQVQSKKPAVTQQEVDKFLVQALSGLEKQVATPGAQR